MVISEISHIFAVEGYSCKVGTSVKRDEKLKAQTVSDRQIFHSVPFAAAKRKTFGSADLKRMTYVFFHFVSPFPKELTAR